MPRPRSPHTTGACGISEAHSDEDHVASRLYYNDTDFGDLDPCEHCGSRTERHDPECPEFAGEAIDEVISC
jgi:hypothetical protein